jgi:hypothetical protein
VWKAPPPPIPPGEDTLYYRAVDKVWETKQWIRFRLTATLWEYYQRMEDAALRIKKYPGDLIVFLVLGF